MLSRPPLGLTGSLPPIVVSPHVFAVGARESLVAGDEAEEALWIGARDVFDPKNRSTFLLVLREGERAFPSIQVGPHVIWGLTERILDRLASLVTI